MKMKLAIIINKNGVPTGTQLSESKRVFSAEPTHFEIGDAFLGTEEWSSAHCRILVTYDKGNDDYLIRAISHKTREDIPCEVIRV